MYNILRSLWDVFGVLLALEEYKNAESFVKNI